MNIVFISGQDFSGIHRTLCDGINNLTDHNATTLCFSQHPFGFADGDYVLSDAKCDFNKVREILNNADILHFNDTYNTYRSMQMFIRGKKIIHHFHGTFLRKNWEEWLNYNSRQGITNLVSTYDLIDFLPDCKTYWLPNPIDVSKCKVPERDWTGNELIKGFGNIKEFNDDGTITLKKNTIRIGHSPSNTAMKNTCWFRAAMAKLIKNGYNVEEVLISGKKHEEALKLISSCHIFFDQFPTASNTFAPWFYGLSAIEAAAYSCCVVTGVFPDITGECPFKQTTREDLYITLQNYLQNYENPAYDGKVCREYIEKYHDLPIIVNRLVKIYENSEVFK